MHRIDPVVLVGLPTEDSLQVQGDPITRVISGNSHQGAIVPPAHLPQSSSNDDFRIPEGKRHDSLAEPIVERRRSRRSGIFSDAGRCVDNRARRDPNDWHECKCSVLEHRQCYSIAKQRCDAGPPSRLQSSVPWGRSQTFPFLPSSPWASAKY
jgi:hypothetical protein